MLTTADKFWIAALFVGANVIRSKFGIDFGLTDDIAANLIQGIGAALVWFVPNRATK